MQVDVDFNSETADAYAVTSLPTFIFIRQKNVLGRYEGRGGELFGPPNKPCHTTDHFHSQAGRCVKRFEVSTF